MVKYSYVFLGEEEEEAQVYHFVKGWIREKIWKHLHWPFFLLCETTNHRTTFFRRFIPFVFVSSIITTATNFLLPISRIFLVNTVVSNPESIDDTGHNIRLMVEPPVPIICVFLISASSLVIGTFFPLTLTTRYRSSNWIFSLKKRLPLVNRVNWIEVNKRNYLVFRVCK